MKLPLCLGPLSTRFKKISGGVFLRLCWWSTFITLLYSGKEPNFFCPSKDIAVKGIWVSAVIIILVLFWSILCERYSISSGRHEHIFYYKNVTQFLPCPESDWVLLIVCLAQFFWFVSQSVYMTWRWFCLSEYLKIDTNLHRREWLFLFKHSLYHIRNYRSIKGSQFFLYVNTLSDYHTWRFTVLT